MSRLLAGAVPLAALVVYLALPEGAGSATAHRRAREAGADPILDNAESLVAEGRRVFRDDTFGDEAFWGGQLRLHQAIAGERLGGVGPGLSPRAALQLGLKVDAGAVPSPIVAAIRRGVAPRRSGGHRGAPAAGAVVGVRGQFDDGPAPVRRDHLRALPLDRGRLVRAGHRPAARRLAQPRPRRRRDRRARAVARAVHHAARDRRGDRAHRPPELGAGPLRRRARARRQGVPPGRQERRDAPARRVRPRGREPAHLHRLRVGALLERVRRQHADAR